MTKFLLDRAVHPVHDVPVPRPAPDPTSKNFAKSRRARLSAQLVELVYFAQAPQRGAARILDDLRAAWSLPWKILTLPPPLHVAGHVQTAPLSILANVRHSVPQK